ncbi:hypothetical protein [Enterococcus sp. AZ192]|uniref:hypothetical protein n=1 Tax=unclassified Enterococcus TaxID=2608891 RepID=UPI003D2B9301
MIKKIYKQWDKILMILLFISAILNMFCGYEFRAFVYAFLLVGLGIQITIAELANWIKSLCHLLYWKEKEREE